MVGDEFCCVFYFFPQFALVPILAPGCIGRESEAETKELQSSQLNWHLLLVILEKQLFCLPKAQKYYKFSDAMRQIVLAWSLNNNSNNIQLYNYLCTTHTKASCTLQCNTKNE